MRSPDPVAGMAGMVCMDTHYQGIQTDPEDQRGQGDATGAIERGALVVSATARPFSVKRRLDPTTPKTMLLRGLRSSGTTP